jgi:hypothetical protein
MKKLITVSYKLSLRKLFVGEHYFFYAQGIIAPFLLIISGLPTSAAMFNALKTIFDKEDNLFKLSQAALQTPEIKLYHDLRVAYFNFLWDSVEIIRLENSPAFAQAIVKLDFLHHIYVSLPSENYYDMSGTIINFLQDCMGAEYQPAIQLLSTHPMCNLTAIVQGTKTANDAFMTLYQERSINKEHVGQLGKLSEIRFDVDDVFDSFVDTINVAWSNNEFGAKDTGLRDKLLEAKEIISAAVHQAQLTLARRGRHKIKDDSNTTDDGTQTPNITPPNAPDISTQNPSDEPHHLDPNEHPAAGE